jgi:hypothetical protein
MRVKIGGGGFSSHRMSQWGRDQGGGESRSITHEIKHLFFRLFKF